MKEHPILFSTPMVQAILEGRKTQTRRIHKHQIDCEKLSQYAQQWEIKEFVALCPFGQPGDRLWVREKFARTDGKYEPEITYSYFADNFHWSFFPEAKTNEETCCQWHDPDFAKEVKWKPSIHMPKTAARIWLEIEEVKVERLIDITQEDAINEGIKIIEPDEAFFDYEFNGKNGSFASAKGSFMSLWCKINGKGSWDANPWVWVIKFKVLSTK